MNEIVRSCVSIFDENTNMAVSWDKINSWDRFWFVLKIREYTFVHGESRVEFTDSCSECDEDIDFELTANGLFYEFPDEEYSTWQGKIWPS